jgi:predicted transcriptional regulator
MEIEFSHEVERSLNDLAAQSGRPLEDIIREAVAGYLAELSAVREEIDRRYDDLKSGRAVAIDGEEAFARLKANTEAQRRRPK